MRHTKKITTYTFFALISIIIAIILPKGYWDIFFGGDQAEIYLNAKRIGNLHIELLGLPSVWGFYHPGPALRFYFNIIYLFSFGSIFLFFLLDTLIKLSILFISLKIIKEKIKFQTQDILFSILFCFSSIYILSLFKTPWSYGIIIILLLLGSTYTLLKQYFKAFLLFNISIQVSIISIIPITILVIIFASEIYLDIKNRIKPYLIGFLSIWSFTIYEAIRNKGGNLFRIISLDKPLNENNIQSDILISSNVLFNFKFEFIFLAILLITSILTFKYQQKTFKKFIIATYFIFSTSIFLPFILKKNEFYYFAYIVPFLLILLLLLLKSTGIKLKLFIYVTLFVPIIINLFSSSDYYISRKWNPFPLSEIIQVSTEIKKNTSGKINLYITGEKEGALALPFLIILDILSVQVDNYKPSNERITIYTDEINCKRIQNRGKNGSKSICYSID
ncbi:hypothetical protein [Leptospira limi]|uniref:Glycosyltransferase RgtA/B/C/D-like domain-containing protein n=1 Tax=Leptospira limi TaxID=2950023 RepID=A0ABT3M0C5_9LEPT|nr:hypothetical protein [Leptospira limi]MCW7463190.1 hypothetical protein [Leptospira limi]